MGGARRTCNIGTKYLEMSTYISNLLVVEMSERHQVVYRWFFKGLGDFPLNIVDVYSSQRDIVGGGCVRAIDLRTKMADSFENYGTRDRVFLQRGSYEKPRYFPL